MKSFFTKLGVLLLGATFAVVGCTDYAEDIRDVKEELKTELDNNQSDMTSTVEKVEADLQKAIDDLKASVEKTYATKEALDGLEKSLNSALTTQIANVTTELGKLRNDLSTATGDLQNQITAANKAISDAKAEIQKSIADLESKKADKSALDKVSTDLANLSEKLTNAEKILAKKADKEYVDGELVKLNTAITAAVTRLTAAETALAAAQADIEQAEKDILANTGNISSNAANIAANATAIATNKTNIENANQLIAAANTEISNLKKTVSDLDTKLSGEISGLSTRVAAAETDIQALKERMATAEANIATIMKDYLPRAEYNTWKSTVDATLAEIKTTHSNDVKMIEEAIAAYKAEVATTYATKAELAADKAALETALETAKTDLNKKIEDAAKAAADEYAKIRKELNDAKAELAEKIEKAAAQAKLDDALLKEELLKALAATKTELEGNIAELGTAVRKEFAAADALLKENIDALEAALTTKIDAAVIALEGQIAATYRSLNNTIEETKEELELNIAAVKKDVLDALEDAKDALQAQIDANAKGIFDLRADLTALSQAHDALVEKHKVDSAFVMNKLNTHIEVYNKKVAELMNQDENLEKAIAYATEQLHGKVTAEYEAALKKAKEEIYNKIKAEREAVDAIIAELKAEDVKIKASIEETNKALTDYKSWVATELAKLATKEELAAARDALEKAIALCATKQELADEKKALEDADKALQDAIDLKADKTALDAAKKALEDAIALCATKQELAGVQTSLQTAIDACATKVEFQNEQIRVNGLISELGSDISELDGKLTEANGKIADLYTKFITLDQKVDQNFTDLNNKIDGVQGGVDTNKESIENLDALVENILNSIQSVVYRPTHADGAARISSAKIGGMILEGNSTLTYKVYPSAYADSLVKAHDAGASFLSYDLISVTKSAVSSLEIKDVNPCVDANGNVIPGQIDVVVRPHDLSTAFYENTGSDSYSAALILTNNNDHYSTEYTNLCVDPVASTYDLVLYNGTEVLAGVLKNSVVFNNKVWSQDLFENIEPMFVSGAAEKLTFAEFAEKYTLDGKKIEIVNTVEGAKELFVVDDQKEAVTVKLAEAYAIDNVSKKLNVASKYSFGTAAAEAKAEVELIAFPYTLKVEATAENVRFVYNEVPAEPFTFLADYHVFFEGADGEVSIEEIEKTYFLKFKNSVTVDYVGPAEIFEVSDVNTIPVTVTLAVNSENIPLATAENVGNTCKVAYKFHDTVTYQSAGTDFATAEIVKTQYGFTFKSVSTEWTYASDASVDATGTPSCSREYSYEVTSADIEGNKVPTDQNISKVFADAASLKRVKVDGVTYEGTTLADAPVSFISVDADNVKIAYDKLAWNATFGEPKTYEVEAFFDRASAEVTVNAEITVSDRNRAAININLGTKEVTFAKNLIVERNVELPLGLEAALVADKNLGAVESVDDALLANILASPTDINYVTKVANTEYDLGATPVYTGIRFMDASAADNYNLVTYGFHINNYKTIFNTEYPSGSEIAKNYVYYGSFKTWYGQEVNVELAFNLLDPAYDFAGVWTRISGDAETGYYTDVLAQYTPDVNGKLLSFSVQEVNLNGAFDVVDPAGNKMDEAAMLAAGLSKKFAMINNDDMNIVFSDAPVNTKINYSGKKDFVNVNGYLTLQNKYNDYVTYYPIDHTIFTGAYKSYQVRKYDPIDPMGISVLEGKAAQTQLINVNKVYTFNVLDNFSLKDVKGNELIDSNEADLVNKWVIGSANNNISDGLSVATLYGLKASYNITVIQPSTGVAPTGITIDSTNGVITVDNSYQIDFVNPVKVQVVVTIDYPQGQRVSAPITYTFQGK